MQRGAVVLALRLLGDRRQDSCDRDWPTARILGGIGSLVLAWNAICIHS